MEDELISMLTNENEVTWKSIINNLVKSEQMDPWDIDISLLSKKFLDYVKSLKKANFRVSGKVILASAILLRMKSVKLLEYYIKELDSMIAQNQQQDENEFYDELELEFANNGIIEDKEPINHLTLIPRTPQPRKRKISVYDLMDALDKALEVQDRRIVRRTQYVDPVVEMPRKKWDLGEMINIIYEKVQNYYSEKKKPLSFTQLLPGESKEEKVMVFMPLLHLSHSRKINLDQKENLGEITVSLV